MIIPTVLALVVRYLLVALFLPFSALEKMLNFKGAVKQAQETFSSVPLAKALIVVGMGVEIFMPLAILTGYADRLAAFIMAGYCGVTPLLWKQFWATGDFWQGSDSKGRTLFCDFMKNFALVGGFLLITFGLSSATAPGFFTAPFSSTHPYAAQATP